MGLDQNLYLQNDASFYKLAIRGTVKEELICWRKANQIHGWIEKNVEEVENCEDVYVPDKNIVELYELCESLLESKDAERALRELPPTSGFFFGSDEVDIWYWADLEITVNTLKPLVKRMKEGEYVGDFIYWAWW